MTNDLLLLSTFSQEKQKNPDMYSIQFVLFSFYTFFFFSFPHFILFLFSYFYFLRFMNGREKNMQFQINIFDKFFYGKH